MYIKYNKNKYINKERKEISAALHSTKKHIRVRMNNQQV